MCLMYLFWSGLSVQAKVSKDIEAAHNTVQVYVNYNPDSCLQLLNIASIRISALEDSTSRMHYRAHNDLRRSEYWVNRDKDSVEVYLNKAFAYYKKHPDPARLAEVYSIKETVRLSHTNCECPPQSAPFLDSALYYALHQPNPFITASVYFQQIQFLQKRGKWPESFEKALLAKEYASKSGDSVIISAIEYLLGKTFMYFHLYHKAEASFNQAFLFARDTIPILLSHYGHVLFKLNKAEEATYLFQQVIQRLLREHNFDGAFGVYIDLSSEYLMYGNKEKAIYYFNKALEINSIEPSQIAPYMAHCAKMYLLLGEKEKAKIAIEQFNSKFRDATIKVEFVDKLKVVADVYEALGNREDAFAYTKRWGLIKDSLLTYSNRYQLGEMERMFMLERTKNKALLQSNQALSSGKRQQALLGGTIALVLLLGGSLVYFLRIRNLREKEKLKLRLKDKQVKQMLLVQEEERRRIARELHDGIGQSLAALKIQIGLRYIASPGDVAKSVDDLCTEVRGLSHQMLPLILEESGIEDALEDLMDNTFVHNHIEADLVIKGLDYRIAPQIETHLYRIAQELTNNILRHSGASKVGIQLFKRHDHIMLVVEDNGTGMEKEKAIRGIGLANVKSRLKALHGKLEVETAQGAGTTLRISVPIAAVKRQTA